jgi:hypothetical protein
MSNNITEQEKLVQLCVMIPQSIYNDLHHNSKVGYRSVSSIVRDILIIHYAGQEVNK